MEKVRIYVFGTPRIFRDGTEIYLRRRKAVALLVYTVLAARPLTREFIATLLWPEHDRPHGLASLRQCLMELQHTLGADLLELDGDHVSPTGEGHVWTDVGAFRSAINRTDDPNRWMQAAELYTGEFLEGFTVASSAEFDNWQTVETEALRGEYVDLLHRIIKTLEDRGDYDWAISWAQTLLRADPLDETAHRSLMRCLEATGERRAALEQYSRCAEIVAEELGTEPEEETTELYRLIGSRLIASRRMTSRGKTPSDGKESPHRPAGPAAALLVVALAVAVGGVVITAQPRSVSMAGASSPTVAVLEFSGLGTEQHTAEWTARGLTELVATKLTAETSPSTVSQSTKETYGTPPPSVRRIGEELGSAFWVEGAVLCTDGTLSVVARILEVDREVYVWRAQYVAENEDLLLFLDSSAEQIARATLEIVERETGAGPGGRRRGSQ